MLTSRMAREWQSGAEGSRTLDLLNAIQALSQLSYGPTGGKRAESRVCSEWHSTGQCVPERDLRPFSPWMALTAVIHRLGATGAPHPSGLDSGWRASAWRFSPNMMMLYRRTGARRIASVGVGVFSFSVRRRSELRRGWSGANYSKAL